MTEKEKMEKGELYDAAIPELIEQLLSTRSALDFPRIAGNT